VPVAALGHACRAGSSTTAGCTEYETSQSWPGSVKSGQEVHVHASFGVQCLACTNLIRQALALFDSMFAALVAILLYMSFVLACKCYLFWPCERVSLSRA